VIRDARIATNSAVLEADLELVRQGLVLYTFGNACGISRADGLVVIKPNGVPYKGMRPDHLVVTDLAGSIVDGHLRPSSDLPTHLVLSPIRLECAHLGYAWGCCQLKAEFTGDSCRFSWRNVPQIPNGRSAQPCYLKVAIDKGRRI